MITQLYLAVGREKDGGKLVSRTYSSATVFAADIDTMERYFSVPWDRAHSITRWIETAREEESGDARLVALPTECVGRVNILVAGVWAILLGCRNTGLKLCCICHILIDKCRVETYIPCPC